MALCFGYIECMGRTFDLEHRTLVFAQRINTFLKAIPSTPANTENRRQLIRSAGSVGANYIEANDSLGPNDFLMRIRIARKEAKESEYWLHLIDVADDQELHKQCETLITEAHELRLILSAIAQRMLKKQVSRTSESAQETRNK